MASHHITYAENISQGKARNEGYNNDPDISKQGIQRHLPHYKSFGGVVVNDEDGIALAQAVAGAGNLTLNGPVSTDGVATLTPARNVTVNSAGDDTGITFTVTGTDEYGKALVETITGANAGKANGLKAFKTVTQIAASGAAAGNVNAGYGDVIGLPFRVDNKNQIQIFFDGAIDAATLVLAVTTDPATATTGDVRGTINPAGTLDGTKELSVVYHYLDSSSNTAAFGVAQYGG